MTNINSRLREWRTFRKLTQEGLAALLGTHVGMVRKYEGGHAIPGGNVLAALAKDGLNINWLLTGEGWMIHDAPKPAAGNDEWRQRMASGRVHWEGNNPAEKAVYWWLMESTRDSLELPWLPRSISLDECQRLVKTAAALLDSVAQHNEGRLVELLLHPEIFGEALHLAFWSLKPLDGATVLVSAESESFVLSEDDEAPLRKQPKVASAQK